VFRAVPAVSSTHVTAGRTPPPRTGLGELGLALEDGFGFGLGLGFGLLVGRVLGDGVGVGESHGRRGKQGPAEASTGACIVRATPIAATMIATRLRIR
jgi:hypothetical protein